MQISHGFYTAGDLRRRHKTRLVSPADALLPLPTPLSTLPLPLSLSMSMCLPICCFSQLEASTHCFPPLLLTPLHIEQSPATPSHACATSVYPDPNPTQPPNPTQRGARPRPDIELICACIDNILIMNIKSIINIAKYVNAYDFDLCIFCSALQFRINIVGTGLLINIGLQ